MSVLMQFAMFPTDKGASASPWVSRVIALVKESGYAYLTNPMGTVVETETLAEAQQLVASAYELLRPDCSRVYCTVAFDIREGQSGRMEQKIASVEAKIGAVDH